MSDSEGHVPQSRRGLSRRLTVQAIYQWLVNETPPELLIRQFREQPEGFGRADVDYFVELLKGAIAEAPQLTLSFAPHLDRPLAQLDPVEHAILLLGAYELLYRPEVPWKVVVNEAVNLAKTFGAEDGFKFVNGVLDKLARVARGEEIERA
jgi:N utilization substance protein B